jgi:hypothetical protein
MNIYFSKNQEKLAYKIYTNYLNKMKQKIKKFKDSKIQKKEDQIMVQKKPWK